MGKIVECSNKTCGERRLHWCQPDVSRGVQKFEVPDDHNGPYFCSLECWGYYTTEYADEHPEEEIFSPITGKRILPKTDGSLINE